ncbi:MAG TPA: hypothetical protein VIF60_17505 [Burkholderiaceae bacterium]
MRAVLTMILFFVAQAACADSIFLVPGQTWGFQFDSPKLVHQKGNASATEYQFEASTEVGFILSAFVEPATGKGTDSTSCMKYYWALSAKNPSIRLDSVKFLTKEPFAVVSYVVEGDYKSKHFLQVNTNYYGFRDDNCIDFHVSQVFLSGAEIDYSNLQAFNKSFGYFK